MALVLTYYGHSTLGFDTEGTRIIVDPFFAPDNPAATATVDDVEADYILVTHGHGDHTTHLVPLAKRTGALVICNADIAAWLSKQGVEKIHGMNLGGAYTFPFGKVKMTIAHHSSRMPDGSNAGNPAGFVVYFNDGMDVYIAGDTALTYDMRLIGEAGGVDLAILPIGDNFTMGPDEALLAAQYVQAKHVIPVHFNTWPVVKQDASAFAERLRRVAEIDCTVMLPGDKVTL